MFTEQEYPNKKGANLSDQLAPPNMKPLRKGFAKLHKILEETMLYLNNSSIRVFKIQYNDPTGYYFVKQLAFDGSLSYRDCLCKIPHFVKIENEKLRLDAITKYLNKSRNN